MADYPLETRTGKRLNTAKNSDNTVELSLPMARMARFEVAPDAVDVDIIVASDEFVVGATNATVAVSPDVPRCLSCTFGAGAVAAGAGTTNVVVVGTDMFDEVITETLVAINGLTEGVEAFKTVTDVIVETAELYTISLDTPSSGTFILGNDDDGWTATIAHNASDADILAALKLVYGDANVISVTSLEVEFLMGVVAALEFDGANLVDAASAAMSTDTSATGSVGITDRLGIPVMLSIPTGHRLFWDGNMTPELADDASNTPVWAQAVDEDVLSSNYIDPGATIGSAMNGAKILDFYFLVPA